jgi:hypothetical protein
MECGKAEFRSYFTWFLYPEALTIRPEAALSLLPLGMLKIAVRRQLDGSLSHSHRRGHPVVATFSPTSCISQIT